MKKKVAFYTAGCRLNQSETAVLTDRFTRMGYQKVPYGEPTDLLVLNTCTVTENAEADCRRVIRRTLRHSPKAFVAVTGCYAQTGLNTLQHLPGVDLVLGNQYKMLLPDYLEEMPGRSKALIDLRQAFRINGQRRFHSGWGGGIRDDASQFEDPGRLQFHVFLLPDPFCQGT